MPLLELTPVFPPIAESTCANKVDGKFIKLTPLFKMLATNPQKSPTIPPPTAKNKSWRGSFNGNDDSYKIVLSKKNL